MPREICEEQYLLMDQLCQRADVMARLSCQISKLIAANGTVPPADKAAEMAALCVEFRSSMADWQHAKEALVEHRAKHRC